MKNKKYSKVLYISIFFYIIMASDILINTYVAYKWFDGIAQIYPSFMWCGLVINPISVSIAFSIATIFFIIGLIGKKLTK